MFIKSNLAKYFFVSRKSGQDRNARVVMMCMAQTPILRNFEKDKTAERRSIPKELATHLTDTVDYYLCTKYGAKAGRMGVGSSVMPAVGFLGKFYRDVSGIIYKLCPEIIITSTMSELLLYPLYIKFGSTKNIEDMYQHEYLYFSVQNGFRAPREPTGRNDPNEGNLNNLYFDQVTMKHDDKLLDFNIKFAWLNEFLMEDSVKICSLYTLFVDQNKNKSRIDPRMIPLGGSALVFHNWHEFSSIFKKSYEVNRFEFRFKPVEYYDPKIPRDSLELHQKDEYFDYQKEYRLMLFTKTVGPIKLSLPGLKKVCSVFKSDEIEQLQINFLNI
jgi:hypothetical protein